MNEYEFIEPIQTNWNIDRRSVLSIAAACKVLTSLDCDSATGPDLLPTRVLVECASSLALPVYLLALQILQHGAWPRSWGVHWIAPIFKKKNVWDPNNYRGVHLTAQLAKVMERLLQPLFAPVLMSEISIGPNQFVTAVGEVQET